MHATFDVRWGQLRVKTVALEIAENAPAPSVKVLAKGQPVSATMARDGIRVVVTLQDEVVLNAGERIEVNLGA
jgi:hypothetical protein